MNSLYHITNLRQQYNGRTVLDIPRLDVHAGEVFALLGPSGAGKSTLLRLLALLEAPTTGRVALTLNDETVTRATASDEMRRQVSMVFQRPLLLRRSVAANVGYGLRVRGQASRVAVDAILDRVGLTALADAPAGSLSGGEAQRVALARGLVINPAVLLLDEPTANLDPYNVELVESLVRDQNKERGTTVVLATHNLFQARRLASRVGLLLDGALVEVAETDTFFESPQDPRTRAFVRGEYVY